MSGRTRRADREHGAGARGLEARRDGGSNLVVVDDDEEGDVARGGYLAGSAHTVGAELAQRRAPPSPTGRTRQSGVPAARRCLPIGPTHPAGAQEPDPVTGVMAQW